MGEIKMANCFVYYDGLCRVCSAEINHYKRMRGADSISFVDITSPDFDPVAENLDPKKIHEEIHAKDQAGNLLVGVDAFILIWSQLPSLIWLSKLAKRSVVNAGLQFAYRGFVKIRPYLPRKSCESSPYCATKKNTNS
jgi:predicted DCC family thiol-disulfide oxidoreductase YuxK